MANSLELLATTECNNSLWTCTIWDPHTSTSVMNYRGGGIAAPRTLNLIGKDYICSVEKDKPLLHVWPLNSQQVVQGMRFVLPGKATACSVSPDGHYFVVGINEKIYIWQTSSGSLITIISKHYQAITVLKFTEDSRYFVSAGEDGMVMLWSLSQVCMHPETERITQTTAGQHDPFYMFSDHALPVVDVFISKMGIRGRLFTASIDRSCKIYDLSSGELLLNLVMDSALTSVTTDPLELNVFTGSVKGTINKFSLTFSPRNKDHYTTEEEIADNYSGHTKSITCLSISQSGQILASGSNDESVILWDVFSKQQIKTIKHKGPLTNVMFFISPDCIFKQTFSPSIILHQFERSLEKDNNTLIENEIVTKTKSNFWDNVRRERQIVTHHIQGNDKTENNDIVLQQEIERLQRVNAELFAYSVKKIIKDNTDDNVDKSKKRKKKKSINI